MKRRFISLAFVLAGAICLAARKPDAAGRFTTLSECGIGLMIAGVVVRLTGRRSRN